MTNSFSSSPASTTKKLQDYAEILAGREEDVKASEYRVDECGRNLLEALKTLRSDRNHLDQLRTLVAEFKRREEAAA
jgi:hypothetical protein